MANDSWKPVARSPSIQEIAMKKILVVGLGFSLILATFSQRTRAQRTSGVHICRHPDNGIEETYTVSVFVACVPKANQCAQFATQPFKGPPNVRFIKGYPDPFVRPWDSNGVANRCDPNGNANVPCWAASELVVFKRAPNKKCLCDSD